MMWFVQYTLRWNIVLFLDIVTYIVELPLAEHIYQEIIAAKKKEIEHLENYDTIGDYSITDR